MFPNDLEVGDENKVVLNAIKSKTVRWLLETHLDEMLADGGEIDTAIRSTPSELCKAAYAENLAEALQLMKKRCRNNWTLRDYIVTKSHKWDRVGETPAGHKSDHRAVQGLGIFLPYLHIPDSARPDDPNDESHPLNQALDELINHAGGETFENIFTKHYERDSDEHKALQKAVRMGIFSHHPEDPDRAK